jgi:hypothetical protein
MQDVFVTHDWRNTPEQEAALALLDAAYGLAWRNFGTPWHDPTLNWRTPRDLAILDEMLHTQVMPARTVLVLAGLSADRQRGAFWVERAVALARRHAIPLVGLPPRGTDAPPPALASLADVWVPWDHVQLAAAIERTVPAA